MATAPKETNMKRILSTIAIAAAAAAFGVPVANAAGSAPYTAICDEAHTVLPCTDTFRVIGSDGNEYRVTYYYNTQDKARLVQSETTLPKGMSYVRV